MLQLQNLRPGEKVVKVLQRHWIIYIYLTLFLLVGIIISISLLVILGTSLFSNMLNITFWLFFLLFLYIQRLNHELDLYIVTNNRIIGMDQISFLNRTITECNLGQVQEVNSQTNGILANLLNFGTLSIQTAGNSSNLKMEYCPDSIQESRKILNVVDDYRDTQNLKGRHIIPQTLEKGKN